MAIQILPNATTEVASADQTLAAGASALVWMTGPAERLGDYSAIDIQFKNADNSYTTQLTLDDGRPNGRFEGPVIWRAKRVASFGSVASGLQLGS